MNRTSSFLDGNDCSGASDDEAAYTRLTCFDELTQSPSVTAGCSVLVFGYCAEPPAGTTQMYEIKVRELFQVPHPEVQFEEARGAPGVPPR